MKVIDEILPILTSRHEAHRVLLEQEDRELIDRIGNLKRENNQIEIELKRHGITFRQSQREA